MTSIGGYLNVQIIYLLRDPELFNLDQDFQGRAMSNILFVSILVGLCFTTMAGYIYDIFMRKWPMFLAGLTGAFMVFVCPYTAPSLFWLTAVRSVAQIC